MQIRNVAKNNIRRYSWFSGDGTSRHRWSSSVCILL